MTYLIVSGSKIEFCVHLQVVVCTRQVLSADGQNQVGEISKQWTGLVKEAFTDADNFGITCESPQINCIFYDQKRIFFSDGFRREDHAHPLIAKNKPSFFKQERTHCHPAPYPLPDPFCNRCILSLLSST